MSGQTSRPDYPTRAGGGRSGLSSCVRQMGQSMSRLVSWWVGVTLPMQGNTSRFVTGRDATEVPRATTGPEETEVLAETEGVGMPRSRCLCPWVGFRYQALETGLLDGWGDRRGSGPVGLCRPWPDCRSVCVLHASCTL